MRKYREKQAAGIAKAACCKTRIAPQLLGMEEGGGGRPARESGQAWRVGILRHPWRKQQYRGWRHGCCGLLSTSAALSIDDAPLGVFA